MKRESLFLILASVLGLASCNQVSSDSAAHWTDTPEYYDTLIVAKYSEQSSAAMDARRDGKWDEAEALYSANYELIPTGKFAAFSLAQVALAKGNNDEVFSWLENTVKLGWIDLEYIKEHKFLKGIGDDPRFEALAAKILENRDTYFQLLAESFSKSSYQPKEFATIEELESWVTEQKDKSFKYRDIWPVLQFEREMLIIEGTRLSSLRTLKVDDKSFDYDLERLRMAFQPIEQFEYCGTYSRMLLTLAEDYLAESPESPGSGEVNFLAGIALSKLASDNVVPASDLNKTRENAIHYFGQLKEENVFYSRAAAWKLANQLSMAVDDKSERKSAVREFVEKVDGDSEALYVAEMMFKEDALQSIWPIGLDIKDLDGNLIALKDYQGKILLLDFWATWCGPCLQELPTLKSVYSTYHDQGVEFLSVTVESVEDMPVEKLKKWTDERGMSWRQAYNKTTSDGKLSADYFTHWIPAPFLIGRDGLLVAFGKQCLGEELEKSINLALATHGN